MNQIEEEYKGKVIPFLKEYKIKSNQCWFLNDQSEISMVDNPINKNNKRLQEVYELVLKEFDQEEILETENQTRFKFEDKAEKHDILIELDQNLNKNEAYKIEISETCLKVSGSTPTAILYGFQSLKQLLKEEKSLPYGYILDYPDLKERRLHLDMARKYISKQWIIRHIHKLAKLKMNTLQLHFSENKGFRIESDFDPEIVSQDGYLGKSEVKEIIEEANLYGVEIIPSLDTPGHVEHILKVHPQFGQVDVKGNFSKIALDITNPQAIDYMKSLYTEFMDLFSNSKQFHIGGDEYLEFNREPFDSQYQPVLDAYAHETLGPDYSWKDIVVSYINDIADHVSQGGVKPRIWNDAIYFGEEDFPQQVKVNGNIAIDYWSHMPWLKKVSSLKTIMDKGHKEIFNVHSSFFYYVLRDDMPEGLRPQHSFDVLDQDRNIYENWTPGIFTGETIDDDNPVIQGACIAVWNDNPDLVSEDVIEKDIHNELITFASKTWDYQSNKVKSFDKFKKQIQNLSI